MPKLKEKYLTLETRYFDDGRVEFRYLGEVKKSNGKGADDYEFAEGKACYIFIDYFTRYEDLEAYQNSTLKISKKMRKEYKQWKMANATV